MSQRTRKRTEAQRKQREGDEDAQQPIQDELEQEAEVLKLRRKNDKDNAASRRTLDYGVLTVIFVSALHFLRQLDPPRSSLFVLISAVQTLLLPLSLSPSFSIYVPRFPPHTHQYVVLVQLALFVIAFNQAHKQHAPWLDIARWAAPEFVAGAVEVQRRGERDMEQRLQGLEEKKYPLKGA